MTTLTRLAELRDSGVISAEEYEAKKAEILSRIWPAGSGSGDPLYAGARQEVYFGGQSSADGRAPRMACSMSSSNSG